jgi:predicted O-methyltransferase YrrM
MGTSLGFTTVFLSSGNPYGTITTVEACPQTALEAIRLFEENQCKNIELINAPFEDFFKNKPKESWDLVFVDGHHDGKALLQYIQTLKPNLKENALLVFEDIRWSEGMLNAWKSLLNDTDFSNQFDLFRMGIIVYSNQKTGEINRLSI